MNKEQNFIVKWIILGGLGWLIGQIFAIFITQLSFPNTPCNLLGSSPLFWLVLGGVFGFFQWIALRGWVDGMRIWIIATAGIFFFIAQLSRIFVAIGITSILLFVLITGILIGFVQYLLLRRFFTQAGWWILSTTISWLFLIEFNMGPNYFIFLIDGFIYSLLTGICFAWINQSRVISKEQSVAQPAAQPDRPRR